MTRINCLTALHATAAAIPIHWETDRDVLSVAMDQCGRLSLIKSVVHGFPIPCILMSWSAVKHCGKNLNCSHPQGDYPSCTNHSFGRLMPKESATGIQVDISWRLETTK